MQEWIAPFLTTEGLVALLTLTALEIILGIDNIVFIAVLCGKLPPDKRVRTSRLGIMMAVVTRVMLLMVIKVLIGLNKHTLFTLPLLEHNFTAKDLVLLLGGLFLLYKSTAEIHSKITGEPGHLPGDPGGGVDGKPSVELAGGPIGAAVPAAPRGPKAATVGAVVVQIMLIDIVFSFDSVITAAGMAKDIEIMVAAVILSALVMMSFAKPVLTFVDRHPTIKVLALSFLVLIGTMLVAESCGQHIPKGYIYFAMAFSLGVEVINITTRSKAAKRGHEHRKHP
jgi:predicted tellurium resistance membrane protein TerC